MIGERFQWNDLLTMNAMSTLLIVRLSSARDSSDHVSRPLGNDSAVRR